MSGSIAEFRSPAYCIKYKDTDGKIVTVNAVKKGSTTIWENPNPPSLSVVYLTFKNNNGEMDIVVPVIKNHAIGWVPNPIYGGPSSTNTFLGWYDTDSTSGNKLTADYVATADVTFYGKWRVSQISVCDNCIKLTGSLSDSPTRDYEIISAYSEVYLSHANQWYNVTNILKNVILYLSPSSNKFLIVHAGYVYFGECYSSGSYDLSFRGYSIEWSPSANNFVRADSYSSFTDVKSLHTLYARFYLSGGTLSLTTILVWGQSLGYGSYGTTYPISLAADVDYTGHKTAAIIPTDGSTTVVKGTGYGANSFNNNMSSLIFIGDNLDASNESGSWYLARATGMSNASDASVRPTLTEIKPREYPVYICV